MKRVVCLHWINRVGQYKKAIKYSYHLTKKHCHAFIDEHKNDPEVMCLGSQPYVTEVSSDFYYDLVSLHETEDLNGAFFVTDMPAKAAETSYEEN